MLRSRPLAHSPLLASAVCLLLLARQAAAEEPSPSPPPAPAEPPNDAGNSGSTQPAEANAAGSSEQDLDALLSEGIRLRRAGRDERALAVLERAHALRPDSRRAQVHLAAAHQAMGHWLRANRLLSQALEDGDDYVDRNRGVLREALAAVRLHIGQLQVRVTPADASATLRLDGAPVAEGSDTAPLEAVSGSHVLEVAADGYFPVTRPVEVRAGRLVRESVSLVARPTEAAAAAASTPSFTADGSSPGVSALTWSLVAGSAAAAAASAVSLGLREQRVSEWNSDDCVTFGRTRAVECGGERDAARTYEGLAIGTAIGAGVLGFGALVSYWLLDGEETEKGQANGLACEFTSHGASCHGTF